MRDMYRCYILFYASIAGRTPNLATKINILFSIKIIMRNRANCNQQRSTFTQEKYQRSICKLEINYPIQVEKVNI